MARHRVEHRTRRQGSARLARPLAKARIASKYSDHVVIAIIIWVYDANISVPRPPTEFRCQFPCRPAFGITKFRCRPVHKISPKRLTSQEVLHAAQGILGGEIDFVPDGRGIKWPPAGWHGELKLPILAASDIIGRLGMRLPSNRDVVRPDPDVA